MKIYHGTTELVARKALTEGLKPRALHNQSNWKHTVESNKHMVYLSTIYAPYFGLCAISKNKENIGIVEIETDLLDESNLRPDEDYIEQATRNDLDFNKFFKNKAKTMKGRTGYISKNLDLLAPFWKTSIENIGNCCYKGIIPPQAITRVAITSLFKVPSIMLLAFDPTITIMNYKFCSGKYDLITRYCMGQNIEYNEFKQNIFGIFMDKETEEKSKEVVLPLLQKQKEIVNLIKT